MAHKLCEFGEKVESMRKALGMPKTELARRSGTSYEYYRLIINGQRPLTAQMEERIIQVLTEPLRKLRQTKGM